MKVGENLFNWTSQEDMTVSVNYVKNGVEVGTLTELWL